MASLRPLGQPAPDLAAQTPQVWIQTWDRFWPSYGPGSASTGPGGSNAAGLGSDVGSFWPAYEPFT